MCAANARPPAPTDALRRALAQTGAAAALVDAQGRIEWCAPALAQILGVASAAGLRGCSLQDGLGAQAAPLLAGTPVTLALPAAAQSQSPRAWSARLEVVAPGSRLLTLHGLDDEETLAQRVLLLEERLALVQELCNAGFFERDPATLEGHWDAQMYRIFGLPVPPAGTPAPHYDATTILLLPEDRGKSGLHETKHVPGTHADRFSVQRPDGSVRQVRSRWRVIHDDEGRPARIVGVDIDETDEVELARRADKLREDLDVALRLGNVAVWRHDLASGVISLDEHGYRLTGLEPRPLGVPLDEVRAVIHPHDVVKVRASAEQTLRTGEPSDVAIRYARAGGGWRHVLSRRALLRDPAGAPVAFIGVLLDETERVEKAQQALQFARRLEAAAEAARIGLWSASEGDALPTWNRRTFELFGLDPAGPALPLADWLRRCVHPDDRDRVGAEVLRWARGGAGAIDVGCRVVRPVDGSVRWLVMRGGVSTGDASGEPRRFEGVVIDVTEQEQTRQRLRDAAERVELVSSAVGLGLWECDPGGANADWDANMFRLRGVDSPGRGVTAEEIASYVHPQDRDAVIARQRAGLGSGQPWRHEIRVCWPDGSVHWLASWSSPVLDSAGREVRRVGLNWDVTESRLAEAAMRERQLAVAESRAKSDFMARISHELRTPLNAVLGFAQLLRDRAAASDAADRERWVGHIEDAGRHLLALIDDVLDLSRIDAGELRVEPRPVRWLDMVRATLPLVASDARLRDVTLVEPADLPGVVHADPVRLRQVLLNLLSNAIKYNRPGGRVWLTSAPAGDAVVLRVHDNGRGIDEAKLRHVFQPFERLGAEKSGVEGTGIGLAIVKALVEAMGGRVTVDSGAGRGTVFEVSLPAASVGAHAVQPAADDGAAGRAAPPAAATRARVLYVEDDAVNALLVRELLASRGDIDLVVADSGTAGLEEARAQRPDLILLDMQLPDMDGLAVLKALRADPATASVTCVALSANAMPSDREAARDAGFDEYWTKPIVFATFRAGLARLLGRPG